MSTITESLVRGLGRNPRVAEFSIAEKVELAHELAPYVKDALANKFQPSFFLKETAVQAWRRIYPLPWFAQDILARKAANEAALPESVL